MAEAPKVVGALANEQPQGGYSLSRAEEDMPIYIAEYTLDNHVCDSLEGVTTRTGGVLGVASFSIGSMDGLDIGAKVSMTGGADVLLRRLYIHVRRLVMSKQHSQ